MQTSDSARDDLLERIRQGDQDGVARLLAARPDLADARTDDGVSVTLYSLYYNEPQIAAQIAAAGATCGIFEAAALGRAAVLGDLLAKDATQANAIAPDGFTPLGLAAFFGQLDAVKVLIARGADVNMASRNAMRVAPLHSAVASERLDVADELLRHGADANAVQQDGFTPLHGAAQNGQLPMMTLLLDYGADVSAANGAGQTALAIAEASEKPEAAALLRERADP